MPALVEHVPPEPPLPEPSWYGKLLCAGVAACAADALTFPVDTAKVRLQVQGEAAAGVRHRYRGLVNTLVVIAKNEGPKKLYGGLVAGLQRQICFASVRIGLYDHTKKTYQNIIEGKQATGSPSIPVRIAAGITTGAMAVFVAQPTDVVKVRLQAAPGRYPTTLSAYKHIASVEGVFGGLWKGVLPNAARNGIVNVAEIVCYDVFKETLLTHQLMDDNIPCHFTSAVAAGFCATMVASPVDVVKTRFMNAPAMQYRGAIHCAIEMGRKEGPKAFYKGAFPSFVRLVSWNISMWISFEQLKILYSKNMMARPLPSRNIQIAA